MSSNSEFEMLGWKEISSTFEICDQKQITNWDRELIKNRINHWICMFGRKYVCEKKELFKHSIGDLVN